MLIKPKKTLKYHLLFKIRINPLHINIVFCEKYTIKKKTEKGENWHRFRFFKISLMSGLNG